MIGRTTLIFLALSAASLACGCGSTVNDDDHADQGTGGSTSGPGTGTGASGPAGSTGSGGACAAYANQEGNGEVAIRVVNNTPIDLYIARNCDGGAYSVLGDDEREWHRNVSCTSSCEDLETSGPVMCGDCLPEVIQVPSYGAAELTWQGTGVDEVAMAESCWFESPHQETCPQVVAAPAQGYHVEVAGYAQCQGLDGQPCNCVDGLCSGAQVTGQQGFQEPAVFSYPAQHAVEVVFESCAFGCPNDDEPQPGSGSQP